jgi:dimethylglycine catabolism B
MNLPVLDNHAREYVTCAYCPKVCRFACPVSDATANESLSTWSKMTGAHLAQTEARPLDADSAMGLHACTGCMRCTQFCKHQNPVGHALFAARGEAIAKGLQPKGASSTLATFAQSQNPFGVELAPLLTRFRAQTPVRYPLFVGCTALVKTPHLIEDALFVSEAFGTPVGVGKASERCCGYPLYAAGALEAFANHAAATARAFAQYHELVVLDPGCAWTLKVAWASVGITPRARVRTLIEVLAENLPHAPSLPPLEQEVGYHDSCKLGRGLGVYDEPRALLSRAVAKVNEAPSCRADGGCAGAGGLLPRTMPDVAVEVARRQAQQVSRDGGAVCSACPSSTRMFARAGRDAMDLVSLLRRWLEQPGQVKP